MPAPAAAQLEGAANGFLQGAGIAGEDAPNLARALAAVVAHAMTMFVAQAMVLPGTPAALDPITGSGAVVGPGRLLPPPAGGPDASQIEGLAQAMLMAQGIRGEDAGGLAKAIAGSVGQAVARFAAQTMVLPGAAIAGFATAAPGLLAPVPLAGPMRAIANGLLQQNGLRGQDAPGAGQAMAQLIDRAFTLFAAQAMVAPSIPAVPGATVGPGRLT